MADGADTADAGGNVRGIGIALTSHHGFEEPWRFWDLPAQLLNGAILQIDHDVAMALNAGADLEANASANIKIGAGGTIEISAPGGIKLIAGGSSIEMTPGSISINGAGLFEVTAGLIKHNG